MGLIGAEPAFQWLWSMHLMVLPIDDPKLTLLSNFLWTYNEQRRDTTVKAYALGRELAYQLWCAWRT